MLNERAIELNNHLFGRPGHEQVRADLRELLTAGLGFPIGDVAFEAQIPEVRGRADAILGRTIFELKSDLRRERVDAESQLLRYIAQREAETGQRYIGIATDGFEFTAYHRKDGQLFPIGSCSPKRDSARDLLAWLQGALAPNSQLEPTPAEIKRVLGRDSMVHGIASRELSEAWNTVSPIPDVQLKRQLWSDQLARVYGSAVDDDRLFLQHTYLTIVAKTMATAAVGIPIPDAPGLLNGTAFENAGIHGAVEADFFNWVLEAPGTAGLIERIAREVSRFDLDQIQTDVLKGLYESLIDPETRHDLGEYYTPDWLAELVCEVTIDQPLRQRVLDPSCGSGTFVFHAVRRYIRAAEAAGEPEADILPNVTGQVFGIDVHPIAVIIARVTYLLALGARLRSRRAAITVPVYLGDALQWETKPFLSEEDVLIAAAGELLHFPGSAVQVPSIFDDIVRAMVDGCHAGAEPAAFEAWLARAHIFSPGDAAVLSRTYGTLKSLHDAGRDDIWGYVARNLSRPVWLSSRGNRADRIVGNPPWLSYRYMSKPMQERFKAECEARGIWEGGKVATHQDLSGYFFAVAVEKYLATWGRIGMVMPYAALNRAQFAGFRSGRWWAKKRRGTTPIATEARFDGAWTFDEYVSPLFPVPACVLFATARSAAPLPRRVMRARGRLPRRDANRSEAFAALSWTDEPWPQAATLESGSAYRSAFRQGATMVPRMFFIVDESPTGLGVSAASPAVTSRRSRLEKPPWASLPAITGNVEREFLRPLLLGESIAPFRSLAPALAVIPVKPEGKDVLSAAEAQRSGWPRLANWMAQCERSWNDHGAGRVPLSEQADYFGKLSAQFPIAPLRVVYSKAGTLPVAAVLREPRAVVDHKLYWAAVASEGEAHFLAAILNAEAARSRIAHLQSRGQWGARDFDKVMFELPIPRFDAAKPLHVELALAGEHAEAVAASVALPDKGGFVAARRAIRDALSADGVSTHIDALVEKLLDG